MDVYQVVERAYRNYAKEKRIIGKTCEGRNIYAFFVGEKCYPLGISQYAMHAREWVTALLGLEHVVRGVKRGGVWVLPLVNPDGAALCQNGIESVNTAWRKKLLLNVNGSYDFSLWKANAEAVDLNVNFAARWGKGASNVRIPASANYIGRKPFSALETLALKRFTLEISPDFTLSWHTKGEEIYWRFHQRFHRKTRDKKLARILSECTGFPLRESPRSAGGYKDWCVQALRIPAFTIETGSDLFSHPFGMAEYEDIALKCGNALKEFTAGF